VRYGAIKIIRLGFRYPEYHSSVEYIPDNLVARENKKLLNCQELNKKLISLVIAFFIANNCQ
jgi:hypothetical protein